MRTAWLAPMFADIIITKIVRFASKNSKLKNRKVLHLISAARTGIFYVQQFLS